MGNDTQPWRYWLRNWLVETLMDLALRLLGCDPAEYEWTITERGSDE